MSSAPSNPSDDRKVLAFFPKPFQGGSATGWHVASFQFGNFWWVCGFGDVGQQPIAWREVPPDPAVVT
jgi:hypothetical protein